MSEAAAGKKKGLPTWAIVLIVVGASAPVVIGILAALAIYGARKYMAEAKRQEAVHLLAGWGQGMVNCGQREGALPPTSPPVPATIEMVSGRKFQSAGSDWADSAFACSGFSVSTPQYFQYQWQRESDSRGVLRAVADLDADGQPDKVLEVYVACSGGSCSASAPSDLKP